ncbi:sensor histidine kinase [Salininema proteolyticum]|uniref:histidine kinase n=1 Tax=Salininema proteolyticum TaxID=1607685 RepID=A0ABV8U0T3_9ACTN
MERDTAAARTPEDGMGNFLIATGLTVLIVVWTLIAVQYPGPGEPGGINEPVSWILLAVSCLALYFRSAFPVTVGIVTAAASLGYYPLSGVDGPVLLAFVAAIYTVAASGRTLAAALICSVPLALMVTGEVVTGWAHVAPSTLMLFVGWMAAVVFFGAWVHKNRQYRAEADARMTAVRDRAVDEERIRIARELHDAVGHHLSVIRVQAVAARRKQRKDPGFDSSETLDVIADTGQTALKELRSIVGVLRSSGGPAAGGGLADLPGLLTAAEGAGLTVGFEKGDLPPLEPELEADVHRVVQEAVTNVVRHAHASLLSVDLAFKDGDLSVTVLDDGVGGVGQEGNGLKGMRERAAKRGGRVSIRNREGGGTVVEATWPVKK